MLLERRAERVLFVTLLNLVFIDHENIGGRSAKAERAPKGRIIKP